MLDRVAQSDFREREWAYGVVNYNRTRRVVDWSSKFVMEEFDLPEWFLGSCAVCENQNLSRDFALATSLCSVVDKENMCMQCTFTDGTVLNSVSRFPTFAVMILKIHCLSVGDCDSASNHIATEEIERRRGSWRRRGRGIQNMRKSPPTKLRC